jgi:hypothetical protein
VEYGKKPSSIVLVLFAWLVVGVPFAWGVYSTLLDSVQIFRPAEMQTDAAPK